jgi:PEP-CTERM motif
MGILVHRLIPAKSRDYPNVVNQRLKMYFTRTVGSRNFWIMSNKLACLSHRTVCRRYILAAVFIGAFGAYAAPASAACVSSATVFCDNTVIQAYNGSSAYNYGGSGFSSPGVGDVLEDSGHPFDTDRLVASVSKSGGTTTLNLQYYTSFNGNDETARYADIFLGGNATNKDSFGYAISVGDEAANGGVNTVGFYCLAANCASAPGANSYETSQDVWGLKTSYIYGGEYKGLDGGLYASPTVVDSADTPDGSFVANVTETDTTVGPFPYVVDVTLSASNQDFNALFGNSLSVFWGTGDCSNDAIEAALPGTKVPEPRTLAVFGAGLAGAAAVRRRRKSKRA